MPAAGATALSLFALSPNAPAFQEYPIGDEIEDTENHFKVALIYFRPVPMEPQGMMLSPDQEYKFTKRGGDPLGSITRTFMPMSADDGSRYGANVKMHGAGTYDCEFRFHAPEGYALHTDDDPGVKGLFRKKLVVMKWTFNYTPRKWKKN